MINGQRDEGDAMFFDGAQGVVALKFILRNAATVRISGGDAL